MRVKVSHEISSWITQRRGAVWLPFFTLPHVEHLVCCDVDLGPVIWRNLRDGIVDNADHIGLGQTRPETLIHWQPGDIIDELLLLLVVRLDTSGGISHEVSSIQ